MIESGQHNILAERQGESYSPFQQDHNQYHKYFYIESYGCQMNFNDSEIVASLLYDNGFGATRDAKHADLILINTCSIREKAEQTVRNRLKQFNRIKREKPGMLIGILGCMAERLKSQLLEEEKLVDLVIGPDAYRTLPALIQEAEGGQKAVNVLLSREETYADINPIRLDSNGVGAFVSIMRGCNNMCSFCVVPFTRGRERSRDYHSILNEVRDLYAKGYREVTLLGQNVDSYLFTETTEDVTTEINFAQLMAMVAEVASDLRIRFSTSHPKDITDEVLYTIKKYDNICKYIHLPLQSGSTRILQLMNRTYTREWYLKKFDRIKEILPECSVSTDIITGFCTETEQDHQDTISVMQHCKFDLAYMYAYSERPGTLAARRYEDDVDEETKKRRLSEIIALHREQSAQCHLKEVGNEHWVLVEGPSKKNPNDFCGRADNNKMVIFPNTRSVKKGEFVKTRILKSTSGTLLGELID